MQIIKQEELRVLTNPHDPRKAEVGKLYELRFTPVELDVDPLQFYTFEFYTFDIQGNPTNKTWVPGPNNYGLVLYQHHRYGVFLVGEDIIHLTDDETFWKIEVIPLIQQSNHDGT